MEPLIVEELRELSLDLQKQQHLVGQAGTYLQDDRIVVQPTVIDLRIPALPSLLVESKHRRKTAGQASSNTGLWKDGDGHFDVCERMGVRAALPAIRRDQDDEQR